MKNNKIIAIAFILIVLFSIPGISYAFLIQSDYSSYQPAGFLLGIWHGLLAPYSLIARWFNSDFGTYAINNSGWFYDFGFLVGVGGSIPIGWIAAIISTVGHIFFY